MSKDITNRIFKTKLAVKIWVTMVLTALSVILFVQISLNIYFNKITIQNSITAASNETSYVAANFSSSYKELIKRFILRTSSSDFKKTFKTMLSCDDNTYIQINNSLQNVCNEYTQMSTLNEAALFVRKTDDTTYFFYSYQNRLRQDVSSYHLNLDKKINGITIFPHGESPFFSSSDVITIAIPLQFMAINELILIAEDMDRSDIILYFFLNTADLLEFFELYCNDNSQGTLYLTDSSGNNISLPGKHSYYTYVKQADLSSEIEKAIANHSPYFQYDNHYFFISNLLPELDLHLINLIPRELITAKTHNINMFLLSLALVSVLMITLLSFLVSMFVTKPLKKLMVSVNEIKTNQYTTKAKIDTKDEIGQLSDEIDSMYNTIQQQIISIKKEEEENYKSKLQLLSEQINPHFLYNALEYINMEVYRNHNKEASSMITSLGNYLRISLSHGDNVIMIREEIEQVKAYVDIMNYRFGNRIKITTDIPSHLLDKEILKCILQPIVENSLKHGFKLKKGQGFPTIPLIHISLTYADGQAVLTISDNGAGIDIDKATQVMLTKHIGDSSEKHFGLYNIHQRLKAYYGNVNIQFQSIPFYENKVILTLPVDW